MNISKPSKKNEKIRYINLTNENIGDILFSLYVFGNSIIFLLFRYYEKFFLGYYIGYFSLALIFFLTIDGIFKENNNIYVLISALLFLATILFLCNIHSLFSFIFVDYTICSSEVITPN